MKNFWEGYPHVIRSQQFSRESLEDICGLAKNLKENVFSKKSTRVNWLAGRIVASLFYEPSTRTRLSFEAAAIRLGAEVIPTDNAAQFSSAAKGETTEDTARVISGMLIDAIVIRHPEIGSARRATNTSLVPIINAGDGAGQHPTQALLDVFSIIDSFGQVDGLKVAMVGDLAHGRTVRSLTYLLSKFDGVKLYFCAPEVVKMRDDIKQHLRENSISFEEVDDLKALATKVDILYMTRIQKERFGDRVQEYEQVKGVYILDKETASLMKPTSKIFHPLPRVDEIPPDVDSVEQAHYFNQSDNGVFVRMALLLMILSPEKAKARLEDTGIT